MVLQFYTFIDGYIVLDFDTIPNMHIIGDVDILPKGTTFTYYSPTLYVAKVPDFRTTPDDYIIINIAAFMNKIIHHLPNLPLKSNVEQSLRGSLTGLPSAAAL